MKLIKHYSYRTTRTTDHNLVLSRDATDALEMQLARLANVILDNHTTYVFEDESHRQVAALFSDTKCYFGKLEVKNW